MTDQHAMMDRRRFFNKSVAFLAGSLLGYYRLPKVFACDGPRMEPRAAIIIDDIGFSRTRTLMFLDLGIPLTFSILPQLAKSSRLAEEIQACGHDIMLHQPMEPRNRDIDPGPGALYVGDGHERITEVIETNLFDIPFVVGVNNHMGSRFTASQKDVFETLTVIKDKDLFFIDSLTTPCSKAYKTAKNLHITAANRNLFLDIHREETAILCQLNKLKTYAIKNGHAIGIGHPYPETARALKCSFPDFLEFGISLIHMSDLMSTDNVT